MKRVLVAFAVVALAALATKAMGGIRELAVPDPFVDSAHGEHIAPDSTTISGATVFALADTLRGKSGALRFVTLTSEEALRLPGFLKTFGELAIRTPASIRVITPDGAPFELLVMRPFGDKKGDRLGPYRLGMWPAERWLMARNYYNPDGFVEITQTTARLSISEHFVLGDFLTHDQDGVWPKYVVLEEKLVDKLELVLQDLTRTGYDVHHVVVLSGFRAPYYNQRGVGEGMARASRHQYGDAADILIDADGDGRMDDLNRNGRMDLGDTAPISAAVVRVEKAHPDLVGGLGTYAAIGPSGPFAHIDVRGTSARWESGWWKKNQSAPKN